MRILVAEDEIDLAQALKMMLEMQKYSVEMVHDGEDALFYAESTPYDLILLDIMMPKKSGIEVVRELRSNGIHTPVLMLTAKSQLEDKVTGLEEGADDYLTKPFALDELLARVRALLRRPQTQAETILKIADLSLDLNTHEVFRNNQKIELTNKEFSLLEYLARNAGRPVSKEQIIAHVWDYDADILPNNIEVYISYLREKVDKPFENKLIKTVRGLGYKIDEE